MSARLFRSSLFKSAIVVATSVFFMLPTQEAHADRKFENWIAKFRSVAVKNGVSRATYDRAFRGITSPDPDVLKKARFQPEFKAPVWQYFDNRVHDESVAQGRAMAKKYRSTLDKIERKYGVSRYILLAIWSMETNYGAILKNDKVMRYVPRSLATLAYGDRKRRKFARSQLIAALKILQHGDISTKHLQGSWAGAMGHTQFIPTSYQAYAVDMDGNGRRDIWNSIPDALATAANLLKRNGWRSGQTWGYEVSLPRGRKFPAGSLTLGKWSKLGVKRTNGKPYPRMGQKGTLKVPGGRAGPAFIVTKNFYVLKRYNNADKYALAVGMLADQIAGYGGLKRDWDRPFTPLKFAEKEELQERLLQQGFYDGKIDGKIGRGSKAAIIAFQRRKGLTPDGYPSKEVLSVLRQN